MYDDEMLDAMFYETVDFDDEAEMQDWVEYFRGDFDVDEDPLPYESPVDLYGPWWE